MELYLAGKYSPPTARTSPTCTLVFDLTCNAATAIKRPLIDSSCSPEYDHLTLSTKAYIGDANAPRRRELPVHRHLTNAREQLIGALTAHFEQDPGWMTIADAITLYTNGAMQRSWYLMHHPIDTTRVSHESRLVLCPHHPLLLDCGFIDESRSEDYLGGAEPIPSAN